MVVRCSSSKVTIQLHRTKFNAFFQESIEKVVSIKLNESQKFLEELFLLVKSSSKVYASFRSVQNKRKVDNSPAPR